ncbi:MAG: hypothetical protein AB8E82_02750 [Aureispira sp.]
MIDINTGHLVIDKERIITPQSKLATVESWELGSFQTTQQMADGWALVEVKNLLIQGLYINISFRFYGQKIDGFTFVFQNKPYEMNPSWESWSKEVEQANLVRFNNWLKEQFGEVGALEWGKIHALYDAKSAASSIQLNYI